jgi:uncharacterized protein (DUF1697 family)
MKTHIALLRAVNVGGNSKIAMADLKAMLADLGYANPQSLLQTGNLIFQAKEANGDKLAAKLENAVAERFGLATDVLIRTAAQWRQAIAANPFPQAAARDPSHLLIMPLKDAPAKQAVKDLQTAIQGRETVAAVGRELYIVYPEGIGRSKLTNKLIESRLNTRGTGRNWNTALKLAALAVGGLLGRAHSVSCTDQTPSFEDDGCKDFEFTSSRILMTTALIFLNNLHEPANENAQANPPNGRLVKAASKKDHLKVVYSWRSNRDARPVREVGSTTAPSSVAVLYFAGICCSE